MRIQLLASSWFGAKTLLPVKSRMSPVQLRFPGDVEVILPAFWGNNEFQVKKIVTYVLRYYTKVLLSALDGALSAEKELEITGPKPPFTIVTWINSGAEMRVLFCHSPTPAFLSVCF